MDPLGSDGNKWECRISFPKMEKLSVLNLADTYAYISSTYLILIDSLNSVVTLTPCFSIQVVCCSTCAGYLNLQWCCSLRFIHITLFLFIWQIGSYLSLCNLQDNFFSIKKNTVPSVGHSIKYKCWIFLKWSQFYLGVKWIVWCFISWTDFKTSART